MIDLNEHIRRMKELFLAEHGIVKPLISEQDPKSSSGQVMQSGTGKENPDVLFDSQFNEDFPITAKQEKQMLAKNPNLDNQVMELRQSPAYKPLIDKIKGDTEMMKIFFFYLNQASRLQFLKQTLDFLQSFTKKRQLEKQLAKNENYTGEENLYNWEAKLVAGDIVKTKTPASTAQGGDAIEIEFPLEVAGKTVYKDNSNEPDATLIQAIDNWIADAKAQIDDIKATNPTATVQLVSIDIASSCSRLRNTGDYEGKTWNQLSKDRGERVYQLMTQKLAAIGVGLNPSLEKVLRGGYNGDGSSGPDPANKFTFYDGKTTNGMSYSKTGAEKLSGPDSQRQVFSYGSLLSTQLDSDQYKFCIVIAKIKITANQGGIEPVQPTITKSQGYSLELNPLYKQKEWNGKLKPARGAYKPKGGGSGGDRVHKTSNIRGKLVQCAAYS
jgi:hypothetical protein